MFHQAGSTQCLPSSQGSRRRRMEDGIQHHDWALRVSGGAVRAVQCTCCFSAGVFFFFLDDILIFSPSLESHHFHVCQVLQRLLEHQLFVKAEKCEFHVTETSFLGFCISHDAIKMDPVKVAADQVAYPNLQTGTAMFSGFCSFLSPFLQKL